MAINTDYKKFKYKTDHVGRLFQLAEELGAFAYVAFGRLDQHSDQPEWVYLPHSRYDGVGGLYYLLQQAGYEITSLPKLKTEKSPSFFKKTLMFLKYLKQMREEKSQPIQWLSYDSSKENMGRSAGICWHIFNENETKLILSATKSKNISVNSLFLWALNKAVNHKLLSNKGSKSNKWLNPINLRGAVNNGHPTANHSVAMKIEISETESLVDLHKHVSAKISSGSYWPTWWHINLIMRISLRWLRSMAKKQFRATQENFVGVFKSRCLEFN